MQTLPDHVAGFNRRETEEELRGPCLAATRFRAYEVVEDVRVWEDEE
jgi:hypothetical protein